MSISTLRVLNVYALGCTYCMKPTGHPKSAVRYLPYARTQTRTRAARRTGVHGGTQAEIPCKLNLEGGASMPTVDVLCGGGAPVRWGIARRRPCGAPRDTQQVRACNTSLAKLA